MEPTIVFYGSWSLLVVSTSANFKERLRIVGSRASDGIVQGDAGAKLAQIDGASWGVVMEWSADAGVSWHPSRVRRQPSIVPGDGLIMTLAADDNTPTAGDGDFNDLVVRFVYLNYDVNPPAPPPPFQFTLPQDRFRPSRGPQPPKDCACACCRDRARTSRRCRC